MVNTSLNLPLSKDRSGSARSDYKIAHRFTCLACPPSNAFHCSEESTHTGRWPFILSLRGFLTSPQNHHLHPQNGCKNVDTVASPGVDGVVPGQLSALVVRAEPRGKEGIGWHSKHAGQDI
ncbi:hypothetical protein ILYODFUR_007547 [Ilyodon furcidens]|uniref:Uncharacterized protein n=1 Tax=Ilyodon furcidens TaxID=33524 RepID=A0ABV0UEM7_9TELE